MNEEFTILPGAHFKNIKYAMDNIGLSEKKSTDKNDWSSFKNLPFWIDCEKSQHDMYAQALDSRCCFNHFIGLPLKHGMPHDIYEYELKLFRDLVLYQRKYLYVKKATGLGITEFMLRYIAWRATFNNDWRGAQACIVTGPNEDLAKRLIDRLKNLFIDNQRVRGFDSDAKTAILNGCDVLAFPSNHIDAMRSLTYPVFILLDEADFFRPGEQQNARDVSERYIAKSNPTIALVSTPNKPDGLYDKLDHEVREGKCIYHPYALNYEVGLGNIYTYEEIRQAQKSPSFPREYDLKFGFGLGNIFNSQKLEECFDIDYDPYKQYRVGELDMCLGIDPAFGGSSKFAFVLTRWLDGRAEVILAEQYENADFNQMIQKAWDIIKNYGVQKIHVDGVNVTVVKALKKLLNESLEYLDIERELWDKMKVVPIFFNQKHKELLSHMQLLVSEKKCLVHQDFTDMRTEMRTAQEENGTLVKEGNFTNDLIDALRLSLYHYKLI